MITIRRATPKDAGAIVGLITDLAIYEQEPDAVEATPESIAGQLASDDPPFECLLADAGDEVVGFALFFRNYSTWRGRPGLYLEDLFVRPRFRGRGIARELLGGLAALALERGFGRMDWAVLDWNDLGAGFYRKLGARPMDEWVMWRIDGEALEALAGAQTR
jgi:GNAT superfamily N-acetyltransferase